MTGHVVDVDDTNISVRFSGNWTVKTLKEAFLSSSAWMQAEEERRRLCLPFAEGDEVQCLVRPELLSLCGDREEIEVQGTVRGPGASSSHLRVDCEDETIDVEKTRIWKDVDRNRPWFLGSVPDQYFEEALNVVDEYNGRNSTGVKDDPLNNGILKKGWKDGMRAKLYNDAYELTRKAQRKGGNIVVAIVLLGGPACDWERWHLTNPETKGFNAEEFEKGEPESHIRKQFPWLRLKVCQTPGEMKSFLERGLPMTECH